MVFLKKLKAIKVIKVKKIYLKEKRGDKNIFLSLKFYHLKFKSAEFQLTLLEVYLWTSLAYRYKESLLIR
ncbi:hypothetical protein A4U60_13965 [Priestia endophytica]|nr:hypothetical protein A4U60_13965 [Priestia endophytica]